MSRPAFPHGYALLIGVGQCAEPSLSLPVAANDGQTLRRTLVAPDRCGYPDSDRHVRLLCNQAAHRSAILEGLQWLGQQAAADPEATVLVYLSGHCWLDTSSGEDYFIPHDFDAYDWRHTALAGQVLQGALQKISAERLLLLLNVNLGATAATRPAPRLPRGVVATGDPASLVDALPQLPGRGVLSACRGQQRSGLAADGALSIYAQGLIRGLQGAASPPGAAVTVAALARYLEQAVPMAAAAQGGVQTPRCEVAQGGEFAVAAPSQGQPQPPSPPPNRGVTVGGNVSGSVIVTGDRNLVSTGPSPPSPPPAQPSGPELSPPERQRQVFISYAWGGESEEIANQVEAALERQGIDLVRDKRDLGFKGRIREFMERIGRGKCVVVVISEKYLKSENCMFELLQIAKHEQFYGRVFPVVLEDARIYKPTDRIRYVQYWEGEIEALDRQMRSVSAANLQGFREDIDLYSEIRQYLPRLTHILKDMNTLTVQIHRESGFEALIEGIWGTLEEG